MIRLRESTSLFDNTGYFVYTVYFTVAIEQRSFVFSIYI